ncbi:S-adenosyl-L-methionine-dependent methyltransferases superfamily protein [Klebsormidium nitens]|uniref:S-adenosyl-L-methionine-dependent methyltransferases superfamily protein n=1 Tax=Klebsormidium nitens TaxID=105231 RepID=A0A1Y1HJQ3_KLENI|nr:S-adenosyl-L-methionine-dependent methyltransferases superfamily protein [Klebsormidium nitens]|eukprot:GAQ78775.1 S-adenosyl-L-methionine-dependent methyltransferases superfamily protein [Klebsormidium nitens]
MGFPRKQAQQAVAATRGRGVEEAVDWIEAKKVEEDLVVGSGVVDTTHLQPSKLKSVVPSPRNDSIPLISSPQNGAEGFAEEEAYSSPPSHVNRRRRLIAEHGGVEPGAKITPGFVNVLHHKGKSTAAFNERTEAPGTERSRRVAGEKDPSTERSEAVAPQIGWDERPSVEGIRKGSVCVRQSSGVRRAEDPREEQASTGAVPRLGETRGGSSGATDMGQAEGADLLSGAVSPQSQEKLGGDGAPGGRGSTFGSVWKSPEKERKQAEPEGTERSRSGTKSPAKRRRTVSKSEDSWGRCGARELERDGAISESDDEFETDVMDDVSTPAEVAGDADFEEEWRGAVKNGPRTCHFLFENVASAHRGPGGLGPDLELEERENVWDVMQRHARGIPPELIDSVKYSVATRKRKYAHNIPRAGRTTLPPLAPLRISEMWPEYHSNFPDWDRRKITDKLNMINTKELHPLSLSALNRKLRNNENLTAKERDDIRSNNLIFTSPTSVANIHAEEVERIMGFPEGHTRCGIPRGEVFKALGNAFQVDTIADVISPLHTYFRSIPGGISVLSLFDGIGGAGVAVHRRAVPIKRYISVENNEHCRTVVQNWWKRNGLDRTGCLEFIDDVRLLTTRKIAELVAAGPLDLLVGGSPCNQLTGNNRGPNNTAGGRSGLFGRESRLFLDFFRVLNEVERLQLRAGREFVVDV